MEDLADRSASELARLVRSRKVSPVEVVEACLARVERDNPAINAVVTLNPRALDDAGDLELRLVRGEDVGLLAGLPVGIKDVTPVAGLRTTYGSSLYRDHVPAEDALIVRRLRDAGAVILGKTNCPEFAAGGNTFNDVFGRARCRPSRSRPPVATSWQRPPVAYRRACASPTAPTSPGLGSIPPSSACAAGRPSGSVRSVPQSTKSISTCRSGGRPFSRCVGCGSSRRCFHGWSTSTGSERTSWVTFAPGSTP